MGASATLTDQLSLVEHLKQNVDLNCHESRVAEVREHTWGEDVARLSPPFDIVLISDCKLAVTCDLRSAMLHCATHHYLCEYFH